MKILLLIMLSVFALQAKKRIIKDPCTKKCYVVRGNTIIAPITCPKKLRRV